MLIPVGLFVFAIPTIFFQSVAENAIEKGFVAHDKIAKFAVTKGYYWKNYNDFAEKYPTATKLSFDQIKAYYNLAPEKYEYYPTHIIYKTGDKEMILMPSSKDEWKKYFCWWVDMRREAETRDNESNRVESLKETSEYLQYVQKDLVECKERAKGCFKQAAELRENIELLNTDVEEIQNTVDDKIVLTM